MTTGTSPRPSTDTDTSSRPTTATTTRPPRLLAPLRAELRRGIGPWLGIAVMVTLIAPMVFKAAQWQGSWGETQSLLHSASALLGGPLATAVGCWQGGRERRRGMTELRETSVRTPLAQTLLCLAPLVLWILAGYVAAAAVVLLATWPYAFSGSPLLSIALTDAAWLGTATVLGFVAGRLIPWRLSAPVAAALMYVTVGFPSYLSSDVRFLSPAVTTDAGSYLPVWWQGPVTVVWLGGLGLAALLAYAARLRAVALLPLAATLAAATLITQTGFDMWRQDPALRRAICSGSAPKICVSGLDGALLPEVTKALTGVTSRLEGVKGAPVAYLDSHQKPRADEGEAALPDVSRGWSVVRNKLTDPDDYALQTAASLMRRQCPETALNKDRAGSERVALTDAAVLSWLAPLDHTGSNFAPNSATTSAPSSTPDGTARLKTMGDEERREWLGRYLATSKNCTPAEVPVL
ncbi:hypothetical protein [Streptomyces sp. ISL-100]|uniref:hypothetical protein n=1 Tax=Streptomyces sp. ISL-100 TaxID=2819173 RepID=UPI001BE82227|nr:hypothetical protein [Streptomyces sp. ISL-100]MBT2400257.1 hypothetical protein [Streptomyces sp. ISL-100]